MRTVAASVVWAGPNIDAFTLFVEPTPPTWVAEPAWPGDTQIYLYHALDKDRRRTGQLAGVHILDFLNFSRWGDLPELDMLWQLADNEAAALAELLRTEQQRAQEEARQHARVRTAGGCV